MRMGRYGRHFLVVLILLCIALACDGGSGNSITTRTIGPEGGTITSSDGRLTLIIPAGALDEDTEVSIKRIDSGDLPPEFVGIETERQYELGPDGLEFNIPITVESKSRGGTQNVDGDIVADFVFLLTSSSGEVELLDDLDIEINDEKNETIVRGSLDHFSPLTETLFGGILKIIIQNVPETIPINELFTVTVLLDIEQDNFIDFVLDEARYDDDEKRNLERPSENLAFVESGPNFFDDLDVTYECTQDPAVFDAFITFSYSSSFITDVPRRVGMAFFSKEIKCTGGEEPPPTPSPPPAPPEPTPMPTPEPPEFGAADIDGTWDFNCEVIQEAFPLIVPNLGDPFKFQADIFVDPQTLDTIITPDGDIFTIQGPLMPLPNEEFLLNGSGSGFLGDTSPNAANIQIEAEGWIFSQDPPDGFEGPSQPGAVFSDGVLRFNFPTLPLDSQSSRADCEGIRLGD